MCPTPAEALNLGNGERGCPFFWFIADFREIPMSHQNIQMNSAAALVPARLATSRLLPERALQANSRKPQDSPASSLPQAPLQRGTISNFCSPCGRLLAGDLSRANAAQSPRKKRSFRLFPEIRDEPFFCLLFFGQARPERSEGERTLVRPTG